MLGVDLASGRLQGAQESFSAFAQLLQRYPKSPYAADARQRMMFLRDRLAEHENYVARYYFERGAWLAAINRAKFAVETYDGAPAVAGLAAHHDRFLPGKLGMDDLAESTRAVLADSYPKAATAQAKSEDKPWYKFW